MRRETKAIIRITAFVLALPLAAMAQQEGPRDIQLPNPMGAHTRFIIIAVGAFLAWCISYVLQIQKEKLNRPGQPERALLLRQKEELLERLASLDAEKEAGTISAQRYDKEFKKAKGRLSAILARLGRKQDSAES